MFTQSQFNKLIDNKFSLTSVSNNKHKHHYKNLIQKYKYHYKSVIQKYNNNNNNNN